MPVSSVNLSSRGLISASCLAEYRLTSGAASAGTAETAPAAAKSVMATDFHFRYMFSRA